MGEYMERHSCAVPIQMRCVVGVGRAKREPSRGVTNKKKPYDKAAVAIVNHETFSRLFSCMSLYRSHSNFALLDAQRMRERWGGGRREGAELRTNYVLLPSELARERGSIYGPILADKFPG